MTVFPTLRTVALAAALAIAGPVAAQSWTLELGAGHAVHDPVSARLTSTTGSLGVRWSPAAADRWIYLTGGAPLGTDGPAWGSVGGGVWREKDLGATTLGLSLSLDGYGYAPSDSVDAGGGATFTLAPGFRVEGGPMRLEVTAGGLAIVEAVGDSSDFRAMFDGGARVAAALAEGFELGADARAVVGNEATYPYVGGSASLDRPWGGVWAFAGRWLTDRVPSPETAIGAGLSLRPGRYEIAASWQQEPVDPVYFSSPRRTWSVTLSRRLGRMPAATGELHVLTAAADGTVTFSLPTMEHGQAPSLVGDFNGWTPARMHREGNRWTVRLAVAPGTYHYAFRGADGRVFVPRGVAVVDDGFGGTSAVLVVR